MHEAAAEIVGATLRAAELVMTGAARRAFSPAGGLHHARTDRGGGFCVYNDLAVAIRWMRRAFGVRVMYIDYDAHHGDGVQEIFYDDPEVLTVSFHESGVYLFPGTGFVDELGAGDGYGYSVNVPLEAETGDDSWRAAYRTLVPALADAFRPDVIVLQNGCDGHVLDPLTHLRATTGLFEDFVRVTCEIADRHCEGRVLATGGGGYAIYSVVPRAWTLVWAALSGREPPDRLPPDWVDRVRRESGEPVPDTLRDPEGSVPGSPRREQTEAANASTVDDVRRRVIPLIAGWGLAF
jgi:acetoin utilization protein AcuC